MTLWKCQSGGSKLRLLHGRQLLPLLLLQLSGHKLSKRDRPSRLPPPPLLLVLRARYPLLP